MFQIRLKELREKKGLSQYEFAKKIGVAQSTVGSWESGRREPNYNTTKIIADFFDVSVDYLISRADDPTPNPDNKKSPGEEPELDIDSIEYALYGEARDLDDDEKQQLLELAKLMRKKRKEKE